MKKFLKLLLLPVFFSAFMLLVPDVQYADAARMGGGRSFGGSSSFSRSVPSMNPGMQQRLGKPATGQVRQAGAAAPTGGLLGGTGFGRFLGPMLVGTALGALLFGGAFSGLGMADILVFGLVIYMITRFMRSRQEARAGAEGQSLYHHDASLQHGSAEGGSSWDALRASGGVITQEDGKAVTLTGAAIPKGFDTVDFLDGAKAMFTRLQGSWDKRDMEDLATFTTPAMLALLQEQAAQDPAPSITEILLVETYLYDIRPRDDQQQASVFFDALLREDPASGPAQVREVWHFVRPKAENAMWQLDGIQQVAQG